MEGPFIASQDGARGAHGTESVKHPDIPFLQKLLEWSGNRVRLLTIAAELPGADHLCKYALRNGIAVELGHQLAGNRDINRLIEAGASALTHLGNGIPKQIDRHDNPIFSGLLYDGLRAMIIADGFHLPTHLIELFIKVKGIENTILVSDLSPVGGLAPGNYYTLGNPAILDPSGRLYNPETNYLVGSSKTLVECANFLLLNELATIQEVVQMAVTNPLNLIDAHHPAEPTPSEHLLFENGIIKHVQ